MNEQSNHFPVDRDHLVHTAEWALDESHNQNSEIITITPDHNIEAAPYSFFSDCPINCKQDAFSS